MSESMKERANYTTYAALSWLAERLPARLGARLFEGCAALAFHLASGQRTTVAANLARVLGRPASDPLVQAATKDAFRSYGRYWFETFHLPAWTGRELQLRMRVDGYEHIQGAVDAGTGCVIALPHMGNWDAAGAWIASLGVPMVSVAEDLRPPRLMELFLRHRQDLGMTIEVLTKGGNVMSKLMGHVRANRVIALVADRDLSGNGVEVEMFGATRRIPAGPAVLARKTGAPLLVVGCYMTPDGWRLSVSPPLAGPDERVGVEELVAREAAGMERAIAADPTQWHMFQPGWP